MPLGSPKLARREQAIEAARRRLRRLEIEAHRIKADLARLEAEYEDDVADWLTRKLRRRKPTAAADCIDDSLKVSTPKLVDGGQPAVLALDFAPATTASASETSDSSIRNETAARDQSSGLKSKAARPAATIKDHDVAPDETISPAPLVLVSSESSSPPRNAKARGHARPVLLSAALHAAVLLLCFTFTFTTLVQQITPLFASPADFDDDLSAEFSEVEIKPTKFDDSELRNVVAKQEIFNITDNQLREFELAEMGAGAQPLGDIGQLDALPSDLGTLMAGAGAPGRGKPGGEVGEAVFFGARSKGDRFVFVVDNSSSMKGGRLESATAELLRTIDSLTPRQMFYVIFVSDQTYPMFFPFAANEMLPASPANKRRLADWLPNAVLASGKNRELIKAIDLAATLKPHAVFLLWDGDLKYSDKVRLDVMTHLTRPNHWNFTIHTLGMGVTSLDAVSNLTAIAQANGGTFQRIPIPGERAR